jgi:Sec7-like guanine-nucleotide exchange factor
MHELIKASEYYESLFSLPKDVDLGNTIMNVADTHKHEIQNMNYGRFLWSKIRYFLEEFVDGYDSSMESDLTMMIEDLPAKEYNRFMDGIVKDDNKIIGEFIKFCEDAVKELE